MKFLCILFFSLFIATGASAQNDPVPFLNQPVYPSSVSPGGSSFTLTARGSGFVSGATINVNGTALTTTFVGGDELTATVPASVIANPSTISVTVANGPPGGGNSNIVYLTVTNAVSTPQFAVLNSAPQPLVDPPVPLAAADFNGDGKIDLLIDTCIELGNGDGTFQNPICLPQGSVPASAIVADFNGDEKLDIAGIDDDDVYVWLGNGDGTFQNEKVFSMPAQQAEEIAFVAGDFNHDGKLDLVAGNGSGNGVVILLGNGDGTFQEAGTLHTNGNFAAAVGDFNNDGNLDVAAGNTLLLGNGDGTFQAPLSLVTGNSVRMLAADVNGDGNLDLIFGSPSGVSVSLGNGDGTFQPQGSSPDSNQVERVLAADFNGDGKLDLAVTNNLGASGTSISLLVGNGDGTFQSPIPLPSQAVTVSGDFNGDGKTDLAGVAHDPSGTTNLSILLQGAWPALSPSPFQLGFLQQAVGTTSVPQTVTLTNTGTATLTISDIAITGANANQFAQTNSCGATLAPSANCQVTVTYSPTAITAEVSAGLTISDNAPGKSQGVSLIGSTPPGSVISISPSTVTFPNQYVGTSGLPQSVTITNTGTGTLTIASVTTTPKDFGNLSGCGNSLAAGASCQIGVFFDPTIGGTRTGTLTITDNASDSPQTINVSGVGQDFSVAASSSSTATVSSGQTANYTLAIAPGGGFNQKVALSCSGGPPSSTCSLSSSSVALNGSSPTSVTVTVSTGVGSASPISLIKHPPAKTDMRLWFSIAGLAVFATLWLVLVQIDRRSSWLLRGITVAGLLCVAVTFSSCGGGGSSPSGGGTPAGNYTITVTGTFSSGSSTLSHATNLNLVVR
jgi:FG-GAP-like repeat